MEHSTRTAYLPLSTSQSPYPAPMLPYEVFVRITLLRLPVDVPAHGPLSAVHADYERPIPSTIIHTNYRVPVTSTCDRVPVPYYYYLLLGHYSPRLRYENFPLALSLVHAPTSHTSTTLNVSPNSPPLVVCIALAIIPRRLCPSSVSRHALVRELVWKAT